jgi:hypothetical protein
MYGHTDVLLSASTSALLREKELASVVRSYKITNYAFLGCSTRRTVLKRMELKLLVPTSPVLQASLFRSVLQITALRCYPLHREFIPQRLPRTCNQVCSSLVYLFEERYLLQKLARFFHPCSGSILQFIVLGWWIWTAIYGMEGCIAYGILLFNAGARHS